MLLHVNDFVESSNFASLWQKYVPLHQLEVRHEVDLGASYTSDVAAKTFTHYIADSQRKSHNRFVK